MSDARSDRKLPSPLTIRDFQGLIREKYLATDAARGTPATFMWFIEEIGELSTALANNAPGKSPTPEERANLEEEFADVIAWLCTLANVNGVELEKALEKYTVKGCGGCEGLIESVFQTLPQSWQSVLTAPVLIRAVPQQAQ